MSEIKVDKIQGTSGSSTAITLSGANSTVNGTLAVTGVHTIGTNAVATSDGGAVTQNLAQGLAKQWVNIDASTSTPSLENSFNVASLTDQDTGLFDYNTTNNFSNAKFAGSGCHDVYSARAGAIESSDDRGNSTSLVRTRVNNISGTTFDSREIMFSTHGDLA